jgi:hypothetical protein
MPLLAEHCEGSAFAFASTRLSIARHPITKSTGGGAPYNPHPQLSEKWKAKKERATLGVTQVIFTPAPNQPQFPGDSTNSNDQSVPVSGKDGVDAERT